ncbi:MAG: ABC transporter permease, partial [Bacteroidales bacterium]|nr:ABC transporter permease [Bacteroidales bacterium]
MFDRDFWQEVLQTVQRQKLRSIMTAFGVFWGLLMLMFLIGAGMGFQEGVVGQLKQIPSNTVAYFSNLTTMEYKGFTSGRDWCIEQKDIDVINRDYPGAVIHAVGVKYLPTRESQLLVTHGDASDELVVAGVSPFYSMIAPQQVVEGRYVNEFDCNERRKACVIGINVAKTLFPNDVNPVGQEIRIDGNSFSVVGVVKKTNDMVNL